jgi:mannonate dehydratase
VKIAVLLTPLNKRNLILASQAGAEEIVIPYPGTDLAELLKTKKLVESHGLKIGVIERLLPHMKFVHNLPGRDKQIEDVKKLIENMGEVGIPVLCYNWMPDDDWQRTALDVKERGGALVTEFNLDKKSQVPTHTGFDSPVNQGKITTGDQLWENLDYFLKQVIPVAEKSNVKLALHPDDPPISPLGNQPRIITTIEAFERVVEMYPSPSNVICFCQGTFASKGNVVLTDGIKRLANSVVFVHFRDVKGQVPHFTETFIDNGKTNMAEMMMHYMKLLPDDVPIRPDHVPTLEGEANENPGYEMLGRLHAIGYMQGLMHALK